MQQFFSFLSWRLFTAQHVSDALPPIIRSSMTAVAAFGFTFVSWWQSCCVRGRADRPGAFSIKLGRELLQVCLFVCLFLARQHPLGQGLLIHEVFRSHTTTHHSRWESYGWVISSSLRPLPDNARNTHHRQTTISPVGFETTISAGELP
jgi:hypothetical protein